MDDTTGTTGATQEPVAEDPQAAPPSYADVKNERLIAQYEAANKRLAAIREKPVTSETLAQAQEQHKILTDIAAEMQTRKEASDALRAEMALLTEVVLPDVGDGPATIGEGIDEAAPPVEGDTAPAEAVPAEKELVAASASAPSSAQVASARADQAAGVKIAAAPVRKPRAWLAAAGMGSNAVVGETASMEDLGAALMKHMRMGSGMRDFNHDVIIASLPGYTEQMGELLGDHNGVQTNDRLIAEAQAEFRSRQAGNAPNPKLAAICDPLDIIRDINAPGRSRATPFRDSLPFRGAGRLGFTFNRSIAIASVVAGLTHSGVGAWSDADQDLVDEDDSTTWKPVYDVTCATPVETRAQELTWGLRFEESTDLSNPERVADVLDALMAAEARRTESYLLRRYDQLSYGYGWATPHLGGLPDVVELVSRLWEKAIYTERIDLGNPTLWIPPGFLSSLRLDKISKQFPTDPADQLAELKAALPTGITVVQLRDLSDNVDYDPDLAAVTTIENETIQGGGDIANATIGSTVTALTHSFCEAYRLRLGWPDQLIAYSTGKNETGVLRSPELIRQNRSIMFGREWIGINKTGSVPLYHINMTLMNAGVRQGPVSGDDVSCTS